MANFPKTLQMANQTPKVAHKKVRNDINATFFAKNSVRFGIAFTQAIQILHNHWT